MGDELMEVMTRALAAAQDTDKQLLEALTLLTDRVYQQGLRIDELESHFVANGPDRDPEQ